jgi:hypothetical protein
MTAFSEVLRERVDDAQEALAAATRGGHEDEVSLHRARLQDLLALAAAHGVDTSGWPGCVVIEPAG